MSKLVESPVDIEQARFVLARKKLCCHSSGCLSCQGRGEMLKPLSRTYLSAVKKAMGITSRYFLVSDVQKFLRDNPDFTIRSAVGGKVKAGAY